MGAFWRTVMERRDRQYRTWRRTRQGDWANRAGAVLLFWRYTVRETLSSAELDSARTSG
jgi:hypothetical protein